MDSAEYDFGFAKIKVQITGHQGFRIDKYTGESKAFVLTKFTNLETNRKTQHSCYQPNPLNDVENDVKLIKNGNIQNTNFYKHWMILFFESGKEFEFKDPSGDIKQGYFFNQDNYREYTFYFKIEGQKVKISGYSVIIDGSEYLL